MNGRLVQRQRHFATADNHLKSRYVSTNSQRRSRIPVGCQKDSVQQAVTALSAMPTASIQRQPFSKRGGKRGIPYEFDPLTGEHTCFSGYVVGSRSLIKTVAVAAHSPDFGRDRQVTARVQYRATEADRITNRVPLRGPAPAAVLRHGPLVHISGGGEGFSEGRETIIMTSTYDAMRLTAQLARGADVCESAW
jgi:hypothetical protein